MELTILMPCLNEEKTIAYCIEEASSFLMKSNIQGEILVADNGSTDNSVKIARDKGVRVISVKEKGYGATLIAGIKAAKGKYVIFGDGDMSYDFKESQKIYKMLEEGYALVIGNRFNSRMERGAMPFIHKYFGVPLLSMLGRFKYKVSVRDFHCGMRGFLRQDALDGKLCTSGMEFATEIIAAFAKKEKKIGQVNITYRKDMRNGKSHIRTFRDGFRHLWYIIRN